MSSLSFHEIPQLFAEQINGIHDPIIQKLYSSITFLHFSCLLNNSDEIDNKNDLIHSFLLNYFINFKFITCGYTKIKKDSDKFQILNQKNSSKVDAIICVEGKCIIIEDIEFELIELILQETKSALINISNQTKDDKLMTNVNEEIKNFSSLFKNEIKNNSFVHDTISPIVCYLIRRYFYPSNFFKDKSFFKFKNRINTLDEEISNELENISTLRKIDQMKQKVDSLKN